MDKYYSARIKCTVRCFVSMGTITRPVLRPTTPPASLPPVCHTTSITSHHAPSGPPTCVSRDQYYVPPRPQRPSHLCVTRPVLRPTTPPASLPPVCHTTSITSHHAPSVPPTCVSHDQYYVPPRPQRPSHPCVTRPVLRPTTPTASLPPVCHTTSITSHHAPSVPPTHLKDDPFTVRDLGAGRMRRRELHNPFLPRI